MSEYEFFKLPSSNRYWFAGFSFLEWIAFCYNDLVSFEVALIAGRIDRMSDRMFDRNQVNRGRKSINMSDRVDFLSDRTFSMRFLNGTSCNARYQLFLKSPD